MANNEAQQVAEALRKYPSCLIATHINPEGDAIGSLLALAMALEQFGIQVSCYNHDGVPENCRFLPGWERVSQTLPEVIPPLVAFVDADSLERCGLSVAMLPGMQEVVRIDHHVSDVPALGPSFVSTKAAAAGELVFALLSVLGATITPEIATCLQTAIMVDTGRFSYTNTTPTTHRIAAELIAAGADLPTIVDWIWGQLRFPAAKLLGLALSSAQTICDGRIAWALLRSEDFHTAEATPEDTEGIIDHIRSIRGSEVSALFSEKHGVVRVSLRSRGTVDVAQLAKQFGGGGHVKAAGLTYNGPIDFATCAVLHAIEEELEKIP